MGILDPRLGERLIGYIEGMSRLTER
jgi:hypothetical protein